MNHRDVPFDYRSTEPVREPDLRAAPSIGLTPAQKEIQREQFREPELHSVNSNPLAPVHELLNAQQREIAAIWGLARANQTIRDCKHPTKAQVLAALDAVQSMAFTFHEQDTCYGDLESAFEKVRFELSRDRKPTHEEATQYARAAWYGDELGT